MRFFALACDYDGTIARDGKVDEETLSALRRVKESGRKLLLVTGRELPDLKKTFPALEVFDLVVAENGGLLYTPATRDETPLSDPVPPDLGRELKKRGVEPLSLGRVLMATWVPHEKKVLDAIRDLGLEMQVIFNKGAVMVLPPLVNKATGLARALDVLDISARSVVGVGDAENDQAFLQSCEFSVAVANALDSVKLTADFVTAADHGAGVQQLADLLLKDELRSVEPESPKRRLVLGTDSRGKEVSVPAAGPNILIAGSSGSGKSTLAKLFLERLTEHAYQYAVIDPEGDYEDFEEAVVIGDRKRVPSSGEVVQLLREAKQNAVANFLGVPLDQRPDFFDKLFAELLALRSATGRPHWLLLDEAHHILPRDYAGSIISKDLTSTIFITVEPAEMMLKEALQTVDIIFVIGDEPQRKLKALAKVLGVKLPPLPRTPLRREEALMWDRGGRVRRLRMAHTRFEHRRHRRKYAEGDLGPDESFYFRGPDGKLNLMAQNLVLFSQVAEGVDDETWTYHLQRGDYTRWFRDVIKDGELADEAAPLEKRRLRAKTSKARIREAIASRYTLPAEGVAHKQ